MGVRRHDVSKYRNNELGVTRCPRALGCRATHQWTAAPIPTTSARPNGSFGLRGGLDGFEREVNLRLRVCVVCAAAEFRTGFGWLG